MAGYNGAWTGQQIDEAVRQVTNKDIPADGVKFSDGQTFQQKYDAGQLTGPAGRQAQTDTHPKRAWTIIPIQTSMKWCRPSLRRCRSITGR